MRLATHLHPQYGNTAQVGILQGDRLLAAAALLGEKTPLAMLALLERGPAALTALAEAAARFAADHRDALHLPRDLAVPAWETRLLAPLPNPRSLRDFYAFEQHVTAGFRSRGRDVPSAWYAVPVFFFGHTGNICGPDDEVPKPPETSELDFELELACVIGRPGRDIPAALAWDHVAAFTILNDWSARDLQRQEMSVGLGPAKGKDFATSLGPVLVTPDELADHLHDDRHDLAMVARINGEEVSRGNAGALHWTFPQLIEHASRHVELLPGDVVGSGTVGTGCLLELGSDVHPWLEPSDVVELEIELIGRLRNTVI